MFERHDSIPVVPNGRYSNVLKRYSGLSQQVYSCPSNIPEIDTGSADVRLLRPDALKARQAVLLWDTEASRLYGFLH